MIIPILGRIATADACQVIEMRLYSPAYELAHKTGWFKRHLIVFRNKPEIVRFYRTILAKGISDSDLRATVVMTLFDYKPEKWYNPNRPNHPVPPPRHQASSLVLEDLIAVAQLTDKLDLGEEVRASVLKGRKEIERLLEFRRLGPEGQTKLIRDLGDDDFKIRDGAQRQFDRYGDAAEPVLREALKGDLPFEARQRIEKLLEKLKK